MKHLHNPMHYYFKICQKNDRPDSNNYLWHQYNRLLYMKRDLLWKSFPRKIINEMLWCSTLTVLLESEKHVNVFIFQRPNLQKYFLVIPLKNKVSHNRSVSKCQNKLWQYDFKNTWKGISNDTNDAIFLTLKWIYLVTNNQWNLLGH